MPLPMTPPRPTEEELFNRAAALAPADRAAFLDAACAGDAKLRAGVDALLKLHIEAPSFMEAAAPGLAETMVGLPVKNAEQPGDWIGRYKLLQIVGEGGCGVVYMAEQEEPVRRRV